MGALLESVQQKTYYEILHLERDATPEQIKESYKEIAKLYHPDSNFYTEIIQDPLSQEEMDVFKHITQAYNTLLNVEKRAAYDKTLPPMLKGWEEGAKKDTDDWNKKKTSVVAPGPGSIDLSKFKNVAKAQTQAAQKKKVAASEAHKMKLLTGLFLMAAACTVAAIFLVLK